MIILIGILVSLLGIIIIYLYKNIALSFDLIFNKLHIDTDIWGSDKE